MKNIITGLLLALSLNTLAQKVGVQFYQGINKPMVSFSGAQGELDYQSNFNSDTRIGVFYGDLSKLSVSTTIGVSTVKATAKNDDLTTSFSQSSLRIDVPIRYAIPSIYKRGISNDFFISSVALVPSYGFVTAPSQSVNGLDSRTEELFNETNFYLGTEINFIGYSSYKLAIHPYISYRYMLSNADLDDDDLKINELSLGLRMDINK